MRSVLKPRHHVQRHLRVRQHLKAGNGIGLRVQLQALRMSHILQFLPAFSDHMYRNSCIDERAHRLSPPVIAHIQINENHLMQGNPQLIIGLFPHLPLAVGKRHFLHRARRMFQQIVYDPPVKCRVLLIDPVDIGFKKGKLCVISGQDHVIAGRRLFCCALRSSFSRLNCGALRSRFSLLSFAFLFCLPQSGSRKRQKATRHILRIKLFKICLLSPVYTDMPVFFRQIF